MKILHINQQASRGGAAGLCLAIHNALLLDGHESAVLVGRQLRELPGVKLIEHDRYRSVWGRFWTRVSRWLHQYSGRIRGAARVSERWLPRLASPRRFWSWWAGYEDFAFPGTRHVLEQAPFLPEVLHLNNLHGSYFDLRELPRLSHTVPTLITLHDTWLLAGHCAYAVDCDRWLAGCGACPHLDFPPMLRRDASALNWRLKREIYRNSRLWVVCLSQQQANKVRQSILMPGAVHLKIIPNGVDLSVFKPGDKAAARAQLGWPQEAFIVMFAANGVRQNIWKDYPTMREAVRLVGERAGDIPLRFFAIGDASAAEQAGAVMIEFVPHRDSMAECYQAADVYLHAARADTFPTVILEALACGTPVVATAVDGIAEQVREGQTGFLVPAGDAPALAGSLIRLAHSPELVRTLGAAAARDAADRFSQDRMVANYTQLYQEMVEP